MKKMIFYWGEERHASPILNPLLSQMTEGVDLKEVFPTLDGTMYVELGMLALTTMLMKVNRRERGQVEFYIFNASSMPLRIRAHVLGLVDGKLVKLVDEVLNN